MRGWKGWPNRGQDGRRGSVLETEKLSLEMEKISQKGGVEDMEVETWNGIMEPFDMDSDAEMKNICQET